MTAAAVCLALAIDVSGSISTPHYALQRDATAAALEQPAVARAARDGLPVAVVMFGSRAAIVVPPVEPRAAATALRAVERPDLGPATNVADAIALSVRTLLPLPCERRVVDVSGDGSHNASSIAALHEAVALAAAHDVQINTLPIVTLQEPNIAAWFEAEVARPTGGFSMPAGWVDFSRAVRAKLAAEVAAR